MTDTATLTHQTARARDLLGNGQPIEALRLGIGDMMAREFNRVPEHCREGLARYVLFGGKPGGFLTAVLCNDLFGAIWQADDVNRESLRDYTLALVHGAPPGSYGSVTVVREWIASGGVFGRAKGGG